MATKLLVAREREMDCEPNPLVDGTTSLHEAAASDSVAQIKLLLSDPRVDPNVKSDPIDMTPLGEAAYFGAAHAAATLLSDPRVDPESADGNGRTPLIHAAQMGHLEIVKLLAPRSEVHKLSGGCNPENALMAAAFNGKTTCVKFLVKLIDPRSIAPDGTTALMSAADGGRVGCIRALAPLSDFGAVDAHGRTALMRAARMGRKRAVLELLPSSDPFFRDANGKDALRLAKDAAERRMRDIEGDDLTEVVGFLRAFTHAMKEMSAISREVGARTSSAKSNGGRRGLAL